MEKVDSSGFATKSYFIALESPRSLKYYLSAKLHHRIVGRFAVVSFLTQDKIKTRRRQSQRENFTLNNSNMKQSNDKKDIQEPPADRSQLKDKKDEKKEATAAIYTNTPDPGPFANYEKIRSDPALVRDKVRLSKEVLATAKTVFPIDPFPDTVILDRTTLNITKRTFFLSNDTLSIRIEDILNVHVNIGPFLGSLTIASRVLSSEDHFTISNLRRRDAIHLKHMIQGYIIALHNEIEISHLSKEELIDTISELGHDLNS